MPYEMALGKELKIEVSLDISITGYYGDMDIMWRIDKSFPCFHNKEACDILAFASHVKLYGPETWEEAREWMDAHGITKIDQYDWWNYDIEALPEIEEVQAVYTDADGGRHGVVLRQVDDNTCHFIK